MPSYVPAIRNHAPAAQCWIWFDALVPDYSASLLRPKPVVVIQDRTNLDQGCVKEEGSGMQDRISTKRNALTERRERKKR